MWFFKPQLLYQLPVNEIALVLNKIKVMLLDKSERLLDSISNANIVSQSK